MHFVPKIILATVLLGLSSVGFAEDVIELSTATVSTVNTFLWLAVIAGVVVGFGIHLYMHSKRMSFDVLIPIIPAILVAFFVIYIPYLLSAPQDFGKVCFQNLTDGYGKIRESLDLAYECAVHREQLPAWGIGSFIAGYKSIFGYTAADAYLKTGFIYFFYYAIVAFWVVVLYLITLFIRRKIVH